MRRFAYAINSEVSPPTYETEEAARAASLTAAAERIKATTWPVRVRVYASDGSQSWIVDRFTVDADGSVERPRRAVLSHGYTPSPCGKTQTGVHVDGVRCGSCYHQHCRACSACTRCERNHDRSCTWTPYRGTQGRRVG